MSEMIVWDGDQNSEEWHIVRSGIPTASQFSRIVTGYTCKPVAPKTRDDYLRQLVAASFGANEGKFDGNQWTERGHELESSAACFYESLTGQEVKEVGFVFGDESRTWGGSPDRLVGDDGGLEIKCPIGKTQVGYLLAGKIPAQYVSQVYGTLYMTGRDWWDFLSFHPKMKHLLLRVRRDDAHYMRWVEVFEEELPKFISDLKRMKEALS
jgi:hypothetical protein